MRVLIITRPCSEQHDTIQQISCLRQAGLDVEVFYIPNTSKLMDYWRSLRELRRFLQTQLFDIIHAQCSLCGLMGTISSHTPLVVTFRDSDILGIARPENASKCSRIFRLISRLSAKLCTEAILLSHHMITNLPQRLYHVLPTGIDLQIFTPCSKDSARASLGMHPHQRFVLFAHNKDITMHQYTHAQQVISIVHQQMPTELMTLEHTDDQYVALMMNACDALLITSEQLGYPSVLKKAMACNLPIVSVPTTCAQERMDKISHITYCTTTPSNDAEVVAEALIDILKQGKHSNSRQYIQYLQQPYLVDKLLGIYTLAMARTAHHANSGLKHQHT